VKAQTRVAADLARAAQVPALPAIRPASSPIDFGASASLVVVASRAGETYQPFLLNQPVADARAGDGTDLTFATPALTDDVTFHVHVLRPADPGLAVERVIKVPVSVRPRVDLSVSAAAPAVDAGVGTVLLVNPSQSGVSYQLTSGGKPVGASVPGTGQALTLPTGPIASDTTFVVRATRASDPTLTADLKAQVLVKVKSASPPPVPPGT
jgi:hypothetical protein